MYRYRATERFWTSFYRLSVTQKQSVRKAWIIFKVNPFDPRLRAHKIHKLSQTYKRIIYALEIEANLRAVFFIDGNRIVTLDIGTHDVYKG